MSSREIAHILAFDDDFNPKNNVWVNCMKSVYQHCWNRLSSRNKIPSFESFDSLYFAKDEQLMRLITVFNFHLIHPNYINAAWHNVEDDTTEYIQALAIISEFYPADESAAFFDAQVITKMFQSMSTHYVQTFIVEEMTPSDAEFVSYLEELFYDLFVYGDQGILEALLLALKEKNALKLAVDFERYTVDDIRRNVTRFENFISSLCAIAWSEQPSNVTRLQCDYIAKSVTAWKVNGDEDEAASESMNYISYLAFGDLHIPLLLEQIMLLYDEFEGLGLAMVDGGMWIENVVERLCEIRRDWDWKNIYANIPTLRRVLFFARL